MSFATKLDLLQLFDHPDRLDVGELDRIMGLLWGWRECSKDDDDQYSVSPVEYGQVLVAEWVRAKLPFSELQRQAILKELGTQEKFEVCCKQFVKETPPNFSGYLVSWFDERYMGFSGVEDRFYDVGKCKWIDIEDKPRHTWVMVLDIAPLYMRGLQMLKERQDARAAESNRSCKGDAPQ